MGSPLSCLLVDAVMKQFEAKAFETIRPRLWIRYVDDTFVILKKSELDRFHQHLNTLIPGIKFTMEEECDAKLPFLDILIMRQTNGNLETTVYRKPTTTDRILNFQSNHPTCHLKSCVRTLFHRADTHCSTPELRKKELIRLFKLFMANGYPKSFVNSCI